MAKQSKEKTQENIKKFNIDYELEKGRLHLEVFFQGDYWISNKLEVFAIEDMPYDYLVNVLGFIKNHWDNPRSPIQRIKEECPVDSCFGLPICQSISQELIYRFSKS